MKKNFFYNLLLACMSSGGLAVGAMAQSSSQPTLGQIQAVQQFNGLEYHLQNGVWKLLDEGSGQYFELKPDRIAISFNDDVSDAQRNFFETSYQLILLKKLSFGWCIYETQPGENLFSKGNACLNNGMVRNVDLITYGMYTQTPDDTYYPQSWHLNNSNDADIDMPEAWGLETGAGSNVVVAIIDSGIDVGHVDIGNTGSDGYHNLYYNPGEDPWSDPFNGTTGNGIDDDGNGYVDDWYGFHFGMNSNDLRNNTFHGTHTTGVALAKTNNGQGVAGVAGGWQSPGCRLMACGVGTSAGPSEEFVAEALEYAANEGAHVVNMSLAMGATPLLFDALQYAHDQGLILVAAAGNSNAPVLTYPAASPLTIGVGGTTPDDIRWGDGQAGNGANYGYGLDLAAPAVGIWSTQEWNTYGSSSGTSFAAPQVTGVAALMLQQNPCLGSRQIRDILTATADKVGGYYYNYQPLIPGRSNELGYGRLNAYRAIEAAQLSVQPGIDLYMRDRFNDTGDDAGYQFTWDYDESPDIWVRNNPDGFVHENQIQDYNIEYNPNDPFYVYVRVGNKGCMPSTGEEVLRLYRSVDGTNSSWPESWVDAFPIGGLIDEIVLPVLQPGESKVFEFEWDNNINMRQCLLARIENSSTDPIQQHVDDLAQDVYQNNNIAMRNVLIQDVHPNMPRPIFDGVRFPLGDFVYVGSGSSTDGYEDVVFRTSEGEPGKPLTDEAEVVLIFDDEGWDLFGPKLVGRTDVRILEERRVQLLQAVTEINGVFFEAGQRVPVYVGYNFLTDELSEKRTFGFHAIQKHSDPHPVLGDHWTGAVHFYITRHERDPFDANAGDDQEMRYGDETVLQADVLNEDAIYRWYDSEGNLIYEGTSFSATPEVTTSYKLEVITEADGYKDYDELEVTVKPYFLKALIPNPVTAEELEVQYRANGASSAYVMISGTNVAWTSNHLLETDNEKQVIDVSALPIGIYSVVLVCNGEAVDVLSLSVN